MRAARSSMLPGPPRLPPSPEPSPPKPPNPPGGRPSLNLLSPSLFSTSVLSGRFSAEIDFSGVMRLSLATSLVTSLLNSFSFTNSLLGLTTHFTCRLALIVGPAAEMPVTATQVAAPAYDFEFGVEVLVKLWLPALPGQQSPASPRLWLSS